MPRRRPPRLIGLASAGAVLAVALAGCGSANTVGDNNGKLGVVASTDVWGSVAEAVGGDQVQVTSIIDNPAADPHSYEATPRDALAAQRAELTLANGGGYDDFFTKLAGQATNAKKLVACDLAVGANCADNEHVWYSFATVEQVADRMAVTLGQLRPGAARTFTANANAFTAKVEALRTKTEQAGAAHPGGKVISTEPVAHYLLQTAKITDVTPHAFAEAVEQESDVPAEALAQVNGLISGGGLTAVVDNAQAVTPVTRLVITNARKAGLPVVAVTETLPAGTGDYISWMTGQVNSLAGALTS